MCRFYPQILVICEILIEKTEKKKNLFICSDKNVSLYVSSEK